MKVLIHASPRRMWYVEEFLVQELKRQGVEDVEIWNDAEKKGNLTACMESFKARTGDGGTWHIQDDVLLCRNFAERCREMEQGSVCGFCNETFTDDPKRTGPVNVEDSWHSFQCVRIRDEYARQCADWFFSGEWRRAGKEELQELYERNRGDDTFYRWFMRIMHSEEIVINAKPNLVEHVDWIVGGSIIFPWRGYLTRAYYWDDEELVTQLKKAVRGKVVYE